jgi:signal peptide peptidase-like protein 3
MDDATLHHTGSHPTVTSTVGSAESYAWAYNVTDSSRVSTFFISILLIVYGSFRSLALEEDKDGEVFSES